MNKKTFLWVVLAVAVLVVLYITLSGGSTPSEEAAMEKQEQAAGGQPGVPSAGTVQIDIKGRSFVSTKVEVGPGTKILWKNFDDVVYTIIGSGFQSKPLAKGDSYSYTFTQPGVYTYYASQYPDTMKGQIIVK